MKAEGKFADTFAAAETAGDCLAPTSDAGAVEAKIEALVANAVCQVAPNRCP